MRIPDKVKYLLVLCSGLLFFVTGCVDTSVQTIPPQIVYNSQVNFTNLVTGGGTATLSLNGQSMGTLGFGEETGNKTVQAGSKTLSVNYASASDQQYQFSTETDYKFRIFIVGTGASSTVIKNTQRYIDQTPDIPSDSALVTFFNGSPGDTVLSFDITGPQAANTGSGLTLGDFSSTSTFAPGDYTVNVTYASIDTLSKTFNYTIEKAHKYTAVVYDTLSTLKFKVFTDD